jgi:cytochrome b561
MALGIFGAFCVGLYMADLPLSPSRIRLFNYHKWAGITLLALAVARLAWRLVRRPPAEPASLKPYERVVSAWTHRALYLLFFAVPVLGWMHSSAAGFPVVWFGKIPLPDLVGKDKELAETLGDVHSALAWTIAVLAALHAAAAVKHRVIDRDTVMDRMLPSWARRR